MELEVPAQLCTLEKGTLFAIAMIQANNMPCANHHKIVKLLYGLVSILPYIRLHRLVSLPRIEYLPV